jgi:hypothetical protein
MQKFLIELLDLILYFKVNSTYELVCYLRNDFLGRVKITVGRVNVNLTPTQVRDTMLYA